MKLVKLGGSVITNKKEAKADRRAPARFQAGVASRLLREIRDSNERAIIVTGAGSFGHVKAKMHGLKEGYCQDSQWDGFVEVSRDVRRLNLMVLDAGLGLGMRLVGVPPSVSVLLADGRIHYIDEGVFRRYISAGLTPVTFGDVALDTSRKFSICGGDILMQRLAQAFSADRAIFVSDVDGIRVGGEGKIAQEFALPDLARIAPARGPRGDDVTGGIEEKARLALAMAAAGTEVAVINGRKKGRLLEALKGGEPEGTWFRRR